MEMPRLSLLTLLCFLGGCEDNRAAPSGDPTAETRPADPKAETRAPDPKAEVRPADEEEFGVYRAVLVAYKRECAGRTGQDAPVFLCDTTMEYRLIPTDPATSEEDMIRGSLDYVTLLRGCDGAMREAFAKANMTPLRLNRERLALDDVILIPSEGRCEQPPPLSATLCEKYPSAYGTIILSRPGFSKDRKRAVILDGQGGVFYPQAGHAYLLEKTGNGWRVVEHRWTWIS